MPKAVAASGLVTASCVWVDNNVNVMNPDGTYLGNQDRVGI